MATVHISLALCLTSGRVGCEEHHHLALGIAKRTGDLVLAGS